MPETRLHELKVRLDAVHDTIIRALKRHDEDALDRALQEQQRLMREYTELARSLNASTTE